MDFNKIKNQKTYKQIIEQFLAMVESGEIKAGDKLPSERNLALMLATSRPSVREAFRTLEILGILEVRHGGGTYVRSFDIAPFINTIAPLFLNNLSNIKDLIDFRVLLEGQAVKSAAISHNKDIIEAMNKSLELMAGEDSADTEQADLDFHQAIFTATGNKTFIFAGECLSHLLYASVHMNRTSLKAHPELAERWVKEHAQILECVSAGDTENAYQALKNHLEGVGGYILKESSDENNSMY